MRELSRELAAASRDQVLLRGLMVLSVVHVAVLALVAGRTSPWALVVLGLLGAVAAVNPHTGMPAFVMLYLLGVWVAGVAGPFEPLSLLGAWSLLVFHASAALAAAVPPGARLPAGLWRRYAVRVATVGAVTAVVWGAAWAVAAAPGWRPGAEVAIVAVAVLAAGVLAHYLLVTRRSG